MNIYDSIILGALQGITEFLPISSSGHLVLGEHFLDLNVETLKSFDVMVHVGTLCAILVYFWKDVWAMIKTMIGLLIGKVGMRDPYARLISYILIGTIPAVIVGLSFEDQIDGIFRDVGSVGVVMILVGIVFFVGEYFYKRQRAHASELRGWKKAFIVGLAQAVALIPGISRSGSTIVAGIFQGVDRSAAARFSFLLGIPAMAGAGLLTMIRENGNFTVDLMPMGVGFIASFIFGLISVSLLMKFLRQYSLAIFAVYLIIGGLSVIFL